MDKQESLQSVEKAEDETRLYLEKAMGACMLLLDSGGCRWGRSLCDDEMGVETMCPGQAMRRYHTQA